jgi:hypothetical protein
VVLLPARGEHRVEASLAGWEPAAAAWRDGDPPLAINLLPAGDVPVLPRLVVIDAGQLPRGASVRVSSPVSQALASGSNAVEVSFERAADGSWAAPPLVIEARDAAGGPMRIEHGTRESRGSAVVPLRADDAGSRIRVRVR